MNNEKTLNMTIDCPSQDFEEDQNSAFKQFEDSCFMLDNITPIGAKHVNPMALTDQTFDHLDEDASTQLEQYTTQKKQRKTRKDRKTKLLSSTNQSVDTAPHVFE